MSDLPATVHPLLAALTQAERDELLAVAQQVTVPAGDLLITQGSASPGLYLLLDGHVQVRRRDGASDQVHELALVGGGSWVGEGAMLGAIASADVVAVDEVQALLVPGAAAATVQGIDGMLLQLDARARRRTATQRALMLPPLALGWLGDGLLELRPLWPDDWRGFEAGQARVSTSSLAKRFFTVPPMTERTFRRLADVDWSDQFAWALLLDGALVAIGRYALQAEDRGVAELALLVADDHQGRGFGRLLVTAVATAAEEHGADELSALARADNIGVQRLLASFGASWQRRDDESVVARWPIAAALDVDAPPGLLAAARDIARTVLHDLTED